jgi:ligand-binding sensor domain-containing protein
LEVFWRFDVNSRRLLALFALGALGAFVACEEDPTIPPPPPPPPQISTVQSWTRSQGLPSNDVFSTLVTSAGELWIGTEAGIAVYPSISSGTTTPEVVNELNGLPNPKVRAMIEHEARVYVATWGGGLAIYDIAGDTWSVRGTANGLRSASVADLVASPTENRVYCATTNGVSIYNVAANTFASFIPPNLLDPVVSAVDLRMNGTDVERWYGPRFEPIIPPDEESLHGITVSRGASTVIKYTLASTAMVEARVNDIYFDIDDNVFWVAFTVAGLAAVDPAASTWTYYTEEDGLPSNLVYSVTRANGTLWAATQGGLARLRGDGRWQGYDRGAGLQGDRVRRVYSDNGSRLWLGFVDGGAARVDPTSAE